jgi:hypothetical protein
MKYTVKSQSDIQAVVIEASGMINTKMAENMVFSAGFELKKSKFSRCLFELSNTEIDPNQTMTEMFMFIDVFKKADIDKSVRLAAIYISGGEHRLHLEKSATFEGYNLKHFTDKDQALSWLCRK